MFKIQTQTPALIVRCIERLLTRPTEDSDVEKGPEVVECSIAWWLQTIRCLFFYFLISMRISQSNSDFDSTVTVNRLLCGCIGDIVRWSTELHSDVRCCSRRSQPRRRQGRRQARGMCLSSSAPLSLCVCVCLSAFVYACSAVQTRQIFDSATHTHTHASLSAYSS